jgi:DNA repair ATPase RecN
LSVSAFVQQLRKGNIGPGAEWRRADFHIHLPGSSDYEYIAPDAAALLGEQLVQGDYAFAVVLKHQDCPTKAELDDLQKHCPKTKLIPGAEINVLVEALFKKIGKDYFFHAILAVNPDDNGDFGYILRQAKERFNYREGDYPAGFRSSIVDLGRFFRERGALFIPAHLHQSKKPEKSRSIDDLYDDESFLTFIKEGAFDALEVRDFSTAPFFLGGAKTKEGVDIPLAVCVASSDAHHHNHLKDRSRSTYVLTEDRTFDELASALTFPHRVALTRPEKRHSRVIGLHIRGAFLPDIWIQLNAGLNAFIGAKGSGKTAVLECLRFVLNTPVPSEREESVRRHVAHVLGSSGYVECLVEVDDGSRQLITRRADSPNRITILDANGDAKTVNAAEGLSFPISILGWHEIEAVADRATARVRLLDGVKNPATVRVLFDELREKVEGARDTLPLLQRQVKRLDARLHDLWSLQKKRSALKRLEEGDMLDLQNQYVWFLETEQSLVGLHGDVEGRRSEVETSVISNLELRVRTAPTGADGTGQALVTDVESAIREYVAGEKATAEDLASRLGFVLRRIEVAKESFSIEFASFREAVYAPRVDNLSPEDREILTSQIQVLEETKQLPLVEKEVHELLAEVKGIAEQLRNVCADISAKRDAVAGVRTEWVEALNAELESVRLAYRRSGNNDVKNCFQSRHGADATGFVEYLVGFGKTDTYENLTALFGQLMNLRLEESEWKVNEVLWDVRFLDLLDVIDDDDVEISLLVGKAGFVPIQNLSAGQRSVAVFPLLLRNARGPLVIDQPEDNLDNRYIADVIAPDLLKRKTGQQFLVTSHNANLVVLTDADLIVHMDSDGAVASIPATGFLACAKSAVRDAVLDVLDGGDIALAARQRKYGLPHLQA